MATADADDHAPPAHLRRGSGETAKHLGRWLVGTATVVAQYPFRRVPLYRRDRRGHDCTPPDLARELPGDPATLQRAADGIGPLFHRRYWIVLADCRFDPSGLLDAVAEDLEGVSPEISHFEGADGEATGRLEVGDELVVRLPGPWDGPVRVVAREERSLRLATLQGHVEAGEIEFRTDLDDDDFVVFTIESWARSGSTTFHHLYSTVPLAREVQLLMWAQVCRGVARLARGVVMSNVRATTHEVDDVDWR